MRPVLADAAEVARRALVELEPDGVGVHLGVSAEDETAATHRFEATLPGYRGWQWAVVVAAPPEAEYATVSESALLPGPDALISPDFIPWEQRVRPGDLGPGDLLAPPADDPRLVPGYVATGDPVVDEVAYEIGLGRTQVLSLEGRLEAAQRWYTEFGPDTEMAKAAPSTCGLCGFYLPLAGALRESFGVCGNAMGADGHVVHIEYGCGAHSDVVAPSGNGSPRYEAFDDHAVDFVEIVRPAAEAEAAAAVEPAQPTESQETAEAEAADAAAAERAALAEGARPESADEVVAAELTSEAVSAPAAETVAAAAPATEAASSVEPAAAAQSAASGDEAKSGETAATEAQAPGAETAAEAGAVDNASAAKADADSTAGDPATGAEGILAESASGAAAVGDSETGGEGIAVESAESGTANGAQAEEAAGGESGAAGAGDSVSEHGSSVAR